MLSKRNNGDKIQQLYHYIEQSHSIVAITGAGISVGAGGITYRQLSKRIHGGGLRQSNDPKKMYDSFFRDYLDAMFRYQPSFSHYALADLEKAGKIIGIITTNEDCKHTMAGSKNVAEIQGGFQVNRCCKCGRHYDGYEIWNQPLDKMPQCESCGGIILPYELYSGIGLYEEAVIKAQEWISQADMLLVIGTNGYYGGAYWNYRRRDAIIVQINPGHTGFDSVADLNIRDECDKVFKQLQERYENNG